MTAANRYDVVIIGGGPAGLAAAISAHDAGAKPLVVERNEGLGGILPQCVHNGFGAVLFGKDMPGPEYAGRFVDEAAKRGIEAMTDTMVISLDRSPDGNFTVMVANDSAGYRRLEAKTCILATGCRERTRAQIRTPGTRPSGVFTAGMVQRLVNIEGYMPGKRFVILGSGDIGMIIARRLVLEGAEVLGVHEIAPHLSGLKRNYVQCLEDFGIPLSLGSTVTDIVGTKRVERIRVSKVDAAFRPIPGTEEEIDCDTLVLSVGLIPEAELCRNLELALNPATKGPMVDSDMETSVPGVYAVGNLTCIHDLVDYVSMAGTRAGAAAAARVQGRTRREEGGIPLTAGEAVTSVVPQILKPSNCEGAVVIMRTRLALEEPVKVAFSDETGAEIAAFTSRYSRPAEMLTYTIPEGFMKKASERGAKEIRVSVTRKTK